jgi:hypothetical protein
MKANLKKASGWCEALENVQERPTIVLFTK